MHRIDGVYVSIAISQLLLLPTSLWYRYTFSLHLRFYFCFANKIIYNIFLDSTYMNFYWITLALQCCYFLLYRSESVIYAYLYICIYPLFFGFPSHLDHHGGLSKVPCSESSLVIYVIHSSAFSCMKSTKKKLCLKTVIKINIKKVRYMIKKTHLCSWINAFSD